jgi:hypothetical protein
MRTQYKILAEKYDQVAEAAPALTMDKIVSELAKETEAWAVYVDTGDLPYDISYQSFIDFVIGSPSLKRNIKAVWNAMTPRYKKKIYNHVINELKIRDSLRENFEAAVLKALKYNKKELKNFTLWLFSKYKMDYNTDTLQDWFWGRVGDYEYEQPDEDPDQLTLNLLLKHIGEWRNYLKAGKEIKKASDTAQVNLDI